SSMDYDASLDTLIRHAVPTLADWAVVHIARHDGSVRRIGPAYADPALAPLAEEIGRAAPALRVPVRTTSSAVNAVWQGRALLVPEFAPEWVENVIPEGRYRELVMRLHPSSMMIVPLLARGRALGSVTFVSLKPERRYGKSDLTFAEEV